MKIRRNLKLIPWFNFFIEFRFINVVAILFYAVVSGSYALGMTVFTVALFSTSIFEVPTGILSDKIGRTKTMSLGALSDVLSMLTFGFAGFYGLYSLLIVGAVLQGLAESFYSGTEHALLYETMAEVRKKHKYHDVFGKTSSIFQISSAFSALIGAGLTYFISYTFVAFLTVIPMLICFIITLFYVEPKKHLIEEESNNIFSHLGEAFKLFIKNKKLRYFTFANVLDSSFGNTSHRFQVAFFETLIPVWLIGVARMLKQLCGAVSFWFAGRLINKFGALKLLIIGPIFTNGMKIVGLLLNSVISPFLFSFVNLFYGTNSTVESQLMQNEFTDKQRATMGSLISFLGNIVFGIVSIGIGWLADQTSTVTALYTLMLPEIVIVWIYWKVLRKKKG
jgi:MFS family permease